jgi:hypothetical protein
MVTGSMAADLRRIAGIASEAISASAAAAARNQNPCV